MERFDLINDLSLTIEQIVIGLILYDDDRLDYIASMIRPSDFRHAAHRTIFQALVDVYDAMGRVDAITLAAGLIDRDEFDAIGGDELLSRIVLGIDPDDDPRYYAGIMRRLSNRGVDYEEYLRSPEWKRRADDAKRRADWRCQVCNRPRSEVMLDTHHRTYERLGHENPNDLIVLCRDCHDLFHRAGKLVSRGVRL